MSVLDYILIVVAVVLIGIGSWVWVAGLIAFACSQWWASRDRYMKQRDGEVVELLRNKDVN